MNSPGWLEIFREVAGLAHKQNRSVTIVAVSKGHSADRIGYSLEHCPGIQIMGESYLEEALEKRKSMSPSDLAKIEWHFLGRLQSRKISEIAQNFSCIHTVARLKEIEALAKQATPPKFFLQVNTSNEPQKNGFAIAELAAAIERCAQLKIDDRIMGLMTLPSPIDEVGEIKLRHEFSLLRDLRNKHLPGKLLNMGTSSDYPIAIEEGADWIRLGTVLFGDRE